MVHAKNGLSFVTIVTEVEVFVLLKGCKNFP